MNIIREVDEKDREKYQKTVSHVTQSWEWGEFRKETGVKTVRLGEFDKTKLISAWQVFFHLVPHTNYTIGYLPRTQLPNQQIFNILREIGQKNNCLFIRLEPNITTNNQQLTINNILVKGKPILPTHTLLLDLTKTEDQILESMHEKTRYNIKITQKYNILIKEENTLEAVEIFLNFLEETESRQGFCTHPKGYFRKQWQSLQPSKMIHILLAYYNNQPISGIWLLRFRDQLYYAYGGSSELHREKMPNYLLHWEAIKLGQKINCKVYDFWGSYLEKPEQTDPWYGIHRFKSGFGGQMVNYVGAYDFVLNSSGYEFYKLADFFRWRLLKVKRILAKLS